MSQDMFHLPRRASPSMVSLYRWIGRQSQTGGNLSVGFCADVFLPGFRPGTTILLRAWGVAVNNGSPCTTTWYLAAGPSTPLVILEYAAGENQYYVESRIQMTAIPDPNVGLVSAITTSVGAQPSSIATGIPISLSQGTLQLRPRIVMLAGAGTPSFAINGMLVDLLTDI